ncbi:MAG: hypothetical protein COW05_01415, partial [Gammaproteobacteria bacterium CG12_big_fil_rev_8_21_14_0_65_46_12]
LQMPKSVTYVSGIKCYLCLKSYIKKSHPKGDFFLEIRSVRLDENLRQVRQICRSRFEREAPRRGEPQGWGE